MRLLLLVRGMTIPLRRLFRGPKLHLRANYRPRLRDRKIYRCSRRHHRGDMVSSTLGLCRNRSGDKRTFRLRFAPGPGIHLDSDIRSAKREARADWLEYGRF